MKIILIALGLFSVQAQYCDKELLYHEDYGYGYDITCEGLSPKTELLLRNISVYNEIILKIRNSNFSEFPENLFGNVQKIKELSLSNSTFNNNKEAIRKLKNLQHITIENTNFQPINKNTFRNLDHLRELNLVNISLKQLEEHVLDSLDNLEILRLVGNQIKSISDVSLCKLPKLKYFRVDFNNIETVDACDFMCLEAKSSKPVLTLNDNDYSLSVENNAIEKRSLNLLELNLNYNHISSLNSLMGAFYLKILHIEGNQITSINDDLFRLVDDLEVLNFKNNNIHTITDSAFSPLKQLKTIDLANNNLEKVHLKNLLLLQKINLSKNRILSHNLIYLQNLPQLEFLILSENQIHTLPKNFSQHFPALQTFDVSHNTLTSIDEIFEGYQKLRHLILKNNTIFEIPANAFNSLLNLESLDLSFNKLQSVATNNSFLTLGNLLCLNMSYNVIEYLNYDAFRSLHNLQILDIAGNKLQRFNYNILSFLPSLTMIQIKLNHWSCEHLEQIIQFFKTQRITFHVNEDLEYEKQNIAGIYCEPNSASNLALKNKTSVFPNFAIGILSLLLVILLVVCIYKVIIYRRRQYYVFNDIELLED